MYLPPGFQHPDHDCSNHRIESEYGDYCQLCGSLIND